VGSENWGRPRLVFKASFVPFGIKYPRGRALRYFVNGLSGGEDPHWWMFCEKI